MVGLIGLLVRSIRDASQDNEPGAVRNDSPGLRSRDHHLSCERQMAPRPRASYRAEKRIRRAEWKAVRAEQRLQRAEMRADRRNLRAERRSERRSGASSSRSGREQRSNSNSSTSQHCQPPPEQSYGYTTNIPDRTDAAYAGAATSSRGVQDTKGASAAPATHGVHRTGGPSDENAIPSEAPPPYEEIQRKA